MEEGSIRKITILLNLVLSMIIFTGCFNLSKNGSHNPLSSQLDLLQSDISSNQSSIEQSNILGNRVTSTKQVKLGKFSYDPPPNYFRKIKKVIPSIPGKIRFKLEWESCDSLLLKIGNMLVKKAENGKPYKVSLPPRDLDLKANNSLSQLLAELNLPEGIYNYLQFEVLEAKVIERGKVYQCIVPARMVRFQGKFEIKKDYATELNIKLFQKRLLVKIINDKDKIFILNPIIRITSKLVELKPPVITGDVNFTILDYVSKTPISSVTINIFNSSSSFTLSTNSNGNANIKDILAGKYQVTLTHPNYLDKSFEIDVSAGEVLEVHSELNPAIIRSKPVSTEWFARAYPLSTATGTYAEMALELPIQINFISLAFKKVELEYDAELWIASGRAFIYFSHLQQVNINQNLGTWWVGNTATLGISLGTISPANPPRHYIHDVTEYVVNNPSDKYYLAVRNIVEPPMRMLNVQMTIYYK